MGMSLDFDVDLEKGVVDFDNVYTKSPEKPLKPVSPENKPVINGQETVGSLENDACPVQCAISKPGWGRSDRKEKRKKSASKPPRPPRGPSLDAADQKLIREIAELAMLKRARIERMRALKKSRAAKAASAASSLGNVFATLITAIFFFVLIFQGLSPRAAASSGNGNSHLVDAGKANGGFVSVQIQYAGNPSASEPDGGYTGPVLAQSLLKPVSGLESGKKMNRVSQ
uniref:Transmembrane protein n=1 Tax=Noccaea caerulescens TaxID=107243 RepID=A0A1J3DDD3_NOCCA